MVWREEWLEASLDGVPFWWTNADTRGGARNVIHDIATSGLPSPERLGDGPKRFRVDAFVIGDDYLAARDALEEVLDGGPYLTLVHPTRGRLTVALEGEYSIRESISSQGAADFQFTLVQVEEAPFPEIRDALDEVRASAAVVRRSNVDAFAARFSLGTFASKPINAINLSAARLRSISGRVQSALNVADSFGDAVDAYQREAATLMRQPENLGNSLAGVVNALMFGMVQAPDGLVSRTRRVVASFTQSIGFLFDTEQQEPATISTPEAEQEAENAAAYEDAFKASTLIEAADASVSIPFESSQQVEEVRAVFLERFDQLITDDDTADQLFNDLRDLKAKLLAALSQVAEDLPELTEYTPPATTPALVIAWELYKDPTRDLEIVERNQLRDPGYVTGGEPLQVLNA